MRFFLMFALTNAASAAEWAVIVVGTKGWVNYGQQAEAAATYQLLVKRGIPKTNIITMMYGDIAYAAENPVKGKLFAKPTAKGLPGTDVYDGIIIDYRGGDISPENFLKVLAGNPAAVKNVGSGRVLNSTADDNVFVYFVNHGGQGAIGFPDDSMPAKALIDELKKMHDRKAYKQMVIFLEQSNAGSIFENQLPDDLNVYAVTASNATNRAWSWYCGDSQEDTGDTGSDSVDGIALNTCLGDLFSTSWLEDLESHPNDRTFGEQFASIKPRTDTYAPPPTTVFGHHIVFQPQHAQQFGAVNQFASLQMSAFMGHKSEDMVVV